MSRKVDAPTVADPNRTVGVAQPGSAKAKLAAARLPEKHVPICLRGDLQAEFEELEQQLAEATTRQISDPRLNAGPQVEARRIAERIEALQQEMRDSTIVVKLRALPRRQWDELMKQHPPRPDNEEDAFLGYNPDTFFDAAIRACAYEPADFDDADWDELLGTKTTARQYRDLADAVLALNVRRVSIPNSSAASRILQPSEPE